MQFFRWLVFKLFDFFLANARERRAAEIEAGTSKDDFFSNARNFEANYNAAVRMLKDRLNLRFPDGHYARLRLGEDNPYDHGEDRGHAVDTMTNAIAMALRQGATVKQAAAAGAASVGI